MSRKYSRRLRQIARRKKISAEAFEAYDAMCVHSAWAPRGELKAMYEGMAAVAFHTYLQNATYECGRECALSRNLLNLLTPNT